MFCGVSPSDQKEEKLIHLQHGRHWAVRIDFLEHRIYLYLAHLEGRQTKSWLPHQYLYWDIYLYKETLGSKLLCVWNLQRG